jgi:hypothetical protein
MYKIVSLICPAVFELFCSGTPFLAAVRAIPSNPSDPAYKAVLKEFCSRVKMVIEKNCNLSGCEVGFTCTTAQALSDKKKYAQVSQIVAQSEAEGAMVERGIEAAIGRAVAAAETEGLTAIVIATPDEVITFVANLS